MKRFRMLNDIEVLVRQGKTPDEIARIAREMAEYCLEQEAIRAGELETLERRPLPLDTGQ